MDSDSMKEIFGDVIFAYTRAQAIADGVLVDITERAKEAGFIWPVALTQAVYERYVEVPPELIGQQDVQGRCWDILQMLWVAIRTNSIKGDCGEFKLLVQFPASMEWQSNESTHGDGGGLRLVTLKSVSGPGDDGEPCITVMLSNED